MKLIEAAIKNYRSIKEQTISFSNQCLILVGKNEVGKSNILSALALLNPEKLITQNDLREGVPFESPIESGTVEFSFDLDEGDIYKLLHLHSNYILTNYSSFLNLHIDINNDLTFKKLLELEFKNILLQINISSAERIGFDFFDPYHFEVSQNLKKPIIDSSYNFKLNDQLVFLKDYKIIDIKACHDIPDSQYEDIDSEYIFNFIRETAWEYIWGAFPKAIFWQYDDKYLLPATIDLEKFANNPDYSLPLKSMFELAGVSEITASIKQAKSRSKHALRNLLERVAIKTTEHFRDIWKEYKTIQIELVPNGTNIDASIKDEFNHYEMSQRSDGFKRFISFLLFVSAQVASKKMENTLLIFDEPDLALHPSGQKYLRDELIRISKNNYVIYSTHSIFMIDKKNISRHLIVEKTDERTSAKEVTESNFLDEEVIFNALGYSVFESLKAKNIIFEGWKDKKIFQVALSRVPDKYKAIKKLKEAGTCHAKGVKDIKNIANILELATREYIVISDNDPPARERQNDYIKLHFSGLWKRYDELADNIVVSTVEDFFKTKYFMQIANQLTSTYESFTPLTEQSFTVAKTKLTILEDQLRLIETDKGNRRTIIEEVKNKLFEEARPSDLEEDYYIMLERLLPLIFTEEN